MNKLNKGLAVLALAAGLLGNSCSSEQQLPVYDETRQFFEERAKEQYEEKLRKEERMQQERLQKLEKGILEVRDNFNNYILDSKLSVTEQRDLSTKYRALESIANEAHTSLSGKDKTLYSLIGENITGVDFGTPELEYALNAQGLKVSVEPCVGGVEVVLYLLGFLFSLAILAWRENNRHIRDMKQIKKDYPSFDIGPYFSPD